MQRYIDYHTGFEWHFDDHINPFDYPNTPQHLVRLPNEIYIKQTGYKKWLHEFIERWFP